MLNGREHLARTAIRQNPLLRLLHKWLLHLRRNHRSSRHSSKKLIPTALPNWSLPQCRNPLPVRFVHRCQQDLLSNRQQRPPQQLGAQEVAEILELGQYGQTLTRRAPWMCSATPWELILAPILSECSMT